MDPGRGWCRSGPGQVAPVAGDAERGQGLALGGEVLGEGRAPGVAQARCRDQQPYRSRSAISVDFPAGTTAYLAGLQVPPRGLAGRGQAPGGRSATRSPLPRSPLSRRPRPVAPAGDPVRRWPPGVVPGARRDRLAEPAPRRSCPGRRPAPGPGWTSAPPGPRRIPRGHGRTANDLDGHHGLRRRDSSDLRLCNADTRRAFDDHSCPDQNQGPGPQLQQRRSLACPCRCGAHLCRETRHRHHRGHPATGSCTARKDSPSNPAATPHLPSSVSWPAATDCLAILRRSGLRRAELKAGGEGRLPHPGGRAHSARPRSTSLAQDPLRASLDPDDVLDCLGAATAAAPDLRCRSWPRGGHRPWRMGRTRGTSRPYRPLLPGG